MKIIGTNNNGNPGANERYRLVLSDSRYTQQAMLATQLNEMVRDKRVVTNCVVRLTDYICNNVQGRR